ncbi:MAG TPA: hypothetical protein VEB21_19130, partial [Terriglobales bacterium]|nr:hypothetical protein [Terriglobales bacterium]
MRVAATAQSQHQSTMLVSHTTQPNEILWVVAASVFVVKDPINDGSANAANCPGSNCRFRDALAAAASASKPALITFQNGIAPIQLTYVPSATPREVLLEGTGSATAKVQVYIDGTSNDGDPNPLSPFEKRRYPVEIQINPTDKSLAFADTIRVKNLNAEFKGLNIRRFLGDAGGDQDVLAFSSSSRGIVDASRLDGGAFAKAVATDASGATGKDYVDVQSAGVGFGAGESVLVKNSELRFCWDRAVKVQAGYLELRDNWIHHNLRGGPFVQNTSAHLKTNNNIIEFNGWNCPSGDPSACGSDTIVRLGAAQIATQEPDGELIGHGDIIRFGAQSGILLDNDATGSVTESFICNMASSYMSGIEIHNEASTFDFQGTASVLSTYGVNYFEDGGQIGDVDFIGDNSFVANST